MFGTKLDIVKLIVFSKLIYTYGSTIVSPVLFSESFVFTRKVLLLTSNTVRENKKRMQESLNILKEWYDTSQIPLRNDIPLEQ